MREWTKEEIAKLIKSEKLGLDGIKSGDFVKLQEAERLDKELRTNLELFVMVYQRIGEKNWAIKGSMTFGQYGEMILLDPSSWACHPVNFKTLREFDELALKDC